jgi:hypothetical protein
VLLAGASRAPGISVRSVGVPDIRFTDETYRKYVGKRDKQNPWHSGVDVLTKRGYTMTAVQVDCWLQWHLAHAWCIWHCLGTHQQQPGVSAALRA